MVEGSPLHYYNPCNYGYYNNLADYHYLNRFDPFFNMSDDFTIPHSPNSSQGDSDNSMSSTEISPIQNQIRHYNKVNVQCCWSSCGIIFDTLDQLASHVSKVHAASGPGGLFYCGWEGCTRNNRGFNARYKMLVHVRTHTNEKPHHCFQCDKSFSRAENLKIHTRSHSGEKPYVCPVSGCSKAYSNSSDRFKHTRTHQVDKPYQCKVSGCPKRYTDPSSLRKHVKTYKHFVNENAKIDGAKVNLKEHQIKLNKSCDCTHDCCVTNCLTRAAELLKLGSFINIKENDIKSMQWNQILNPYISEPKKIFSPYIITDNIEIDVPLDLTVSRKKI